MALCSSQDVVFSLNLLILSRIEAPSTFGCGSAALWFFVSSVLRF
jgi:hypothetical protein